ncbi:MAG: pitrilysin family protein [Bacteroidales bacterium]|nr:insulinase family protein [Lentimicrobiaceae bacterium]MDD5693775.1 pitrilysin family protein [Bacteroidales bacterium]
MNYLEYTLPNGIRLVHAPSDSPVAHCGIYIGAGSRDEDEKEHGMAHFIEHAIFKGTKKRKVYHVLSRLENVGADLNAFTTKEETCIYASFQKYYYDRALELISDITFSSVFPDKELAKEKSVIMDEISSYKDTPSDQIFDDFEELVFAGHPLGRNILGTRKNLKRFTCKHIRQFIEHNYLPSQMVISSVGNIPFQKLIRIVGRYFDKIPPGAESRPRQAFTGYRPVEKMVRKSTYQTHCIIGNLAYPIHDPRRVPMALLNNILGGPGMNSRLNLSVREKHGLTYNIESGYSPYSDTGLFTLYLGIDNGLLDKTLHYVSLELEKLRRERLGTSQMNIAHRQFIGQLAIAWESNLGRMLSMGKGILVMNRIQSLEEMCDQIESVTASQLMDIANEVFDPGRLSRLTFQSK